MPPIPYVVQRRHGLYLRVRLPSDIAALTGRSHLTRSLRTADLRQARPAAASLLARAHSEWKEARRSMIASLLGKLIDDVKVDDLPFLTDAQIDSLPEQKRARI